jgi:hypothetical protein
MGRLGMDVESGGPLEDSVYQLVLDRVEYQYKISTDVEGWKDNTGDTDASSFATFPRQVTNPDDSSKMKATSRIRLGFKVEEGPRPAYKGRFIQHDLYMNDASAGFVNTALKALGIAFDETGFEVEDLDGAVGALVMAKISMEERKDRDGSPTGEIDNRIKSLKAA